MKLFIFRFGKVKKEACVKKKNQMDLTAILNQSVPQFGRSQGNLAVV